MLVNQNYILYCDDDNWFDPDHVRNLVHACIENDLDWCFGMRNIYHEGEFLCRDECESVGLWPAWYSNDFVHVDTNCYCLKRETAIQVAPKWHNARLDDKGNVKPSSDTILANYLTSGRFAHAMVPKFTVNYELGSWELSPRPEFFLEGNLRFAEKHGGIVPWEKIS
jgi:glycosyltransferase involved in cell wall biosynthesis